jgi:HNH endonuclease
MTAHHPWLKHSPEKVRDKLDAVSFDAAGLWHAVQMFLAGSGGDGTIERSKLRLATSRRLTNARIGPLVDELVGEGLMEIQGDTSVAVVPWEQPPVDVWTDDVKRARWTRAKALMRDSALRDAVRLRDRNLCRYCGIRVNWSDKRGPQGGTYDHVDPDGDNSLDNIVVACRRCNAKKRDRTPEQAGLSLIPVGNSAGNGVAAGQRPVSRSRARGPDPPAIQIGFESDSNRGSSPPCAPARDRTDPNPIQIGSESGPTGEGPGTGAPADIRDEAIGGGGS